MKKIFFLISCCAPILIAGQSISKHAITSLGHNFSNNTNKLSYTLGEVIIGNMLSENGTVHLGNGYYPSLNLGTLSIEQNIAASIKVYPNPFNEVFYISHPTETSFDIYLFDTTGKKIFNTRVQKEDPINISHYPKGVYLLKITTGEIKKTNTFKIIKQ